MNKRTCEQLNSELRIILRPLCYSLFVIQLFYCPFIYSQTPAIDSLKTVIQNAKHDTSVCDAYLALGEQVYLRNPGTALLLWQKAQDLAEKNLANSPRPIFEKKYLLALSAALNNIGYIYKNQGDIPKGLVYYHKSLKIKEDMAELPDPSTARAGKKGMATSLNNIGLIHMNQGDIFNALEYHHKSLKIQEEIGDKEGISISLNNIGVICVNQGDIPKALECYHKSLKIYEEMDYKRGIAISLNNIGAIYDDQGDISKALEFHHKSLKIREEIGDKKGIAISLNNIGYIYRHQGVVSSDTLPVGQVGSAKVKPLNKALEYYKRSLKIREEIGWKEGIASSLKNIGSIELEQGRLTSALNYGMRGLEVAREIGSPELMSVNSLLLSKVARKQGNLTMNPGLRQVYYKEALEMYELHIQMRDSIKNEETQKATIRQQTKYEFEKAMLVKEQEENEKRRVLNEKLKRRDNLQYSVVLICLLVIGVVVAMLGRLSLPERVAEGLIFFAFLLFFEFLLVLADPYIENWSGGAPGFKLLFNAGIAALIFPMHSLFETKLKGRLVKK